MKKIRKAVVLLSGGLDSTTALYQAREWGFQCFCLIFDYGQRHVREIEAAKRIARRAGCRYRVVSFRLPWGGSALIDRRRALPRKRSLEEISRGIPPTYVPSRNTIFLSFALSYAEVMAADSIFIGAHVMDSSGYPDCRPEYFQAWKRVVEVGTKRGVEGRGIEIVAPLVGKSKAEIIKLGVRLKVPYELTWSCYQGGREPCLKCDSCLLRAKGFREAGIEDPLVRGEDEG